MNNYEKPRLIFSNVRLNENIADTCWGLTEDHNKQVLRYYDVDGTGYVSFNVKQGSGGGCANPDAYNITYYRWKGDEEAHSVDGTAYETELESALLKYGGNGGQPYLGIEVHFPERPSEKWS